MTLNYVASFPPAEMQTFDAQRYMEHIIDVNLVLSDQIWVTALSVCFIFTVTIGTFPAVTVEVKSTIANGGAWGEFGFALLGMDA